MESACTIMCLLHEYMCGDGEDDERRGGEADEVPPAERRHHEQRERRLEARAHRPEELHEHEHQRAPLSRQVLREQRHSARIKWEA